MLPNYSTKARLIIPARIWAGEAGKGIKGNYHFLRMHHDSLCRAATMQLFPWEWQFKGGCEASISSRGFFEQSSQIVADELKCK